MVTQKHIARRLGVSASLVSRALSGTACGIGASPGTIRRILAEAARINYQPSAAALSLRGESARTLGVVIKHFDDPFFGRIIAELQSLATAHRYSLLLTGLPPGADAGGDIHSLGKFRLDGLIIAGSDFVPEGLEAFARRGTPIIRIGAGPRLAGVVNVVVNIEHGIRQLVRYLVKLGHRSIGYIGDCTAPNLRREKSLRAQIARAGLRVRAGDFVRSPETGPQAGYDAMRTMLRDRGGALPTAVVAAEDVLAQTALRALFENGVSVPGELTLAGVDDVPAASMTIPALTTIRQPIPEMVRAAFDLITAGGSVRRRSVSVLPELIIRESAAKPSFARQGT